MTLTINGKPQEFPESSLTVATLLQHLKLDYPVLVELNGAAILQREFPDQNLQEGDRLELFRMVAGG